MQKEYFKFSTELKEEIKNSPVLIDCFGCSKREEFGDFFEKLFLNSLQRLELDYSRTKQINEVMIINSRGGVIGAIAVEILCKHFYVSDTSILSDFFKKIFEEMKKHIEKNGGLLSYYGKAGFSLDKAKKEILIRKIENDNSKRMYL